MAKKRTGRSSSVGKGSGRGDTSAFQPRASGWRQTKERSTGSVSARRSGKGRAVRRPSGHELVDVICSECFEDFSFDTGVQTDTLVCPVCEHSANRPDDGTLHRISDLKRAEKMNFIITFALTMIACVAFTAWVILVRDPANAADGGLFWGPIGVGGLATLVLIVFVFKYEGNRWEAYF